MSKQLPGAHPSGPWLCECCAAQLGSQRGDNAMLSNRTVSRSLLHVGLHSCAHTDSRDVVLDRMLPHLLKASSHSVFKDVYDNKHTEITRDQSTG